MNKKILIFAITLIFVLPGISINSVGLSDNQSVLNSNSLEEYVIEGVPYKPQKDFGCLYASLDMLFAYHGKESSLEKNLFFSGVGYSYFYKWKFEGFKTRPISNDPHLFNFFTSLHACQGIEDFAYIGESYGLKMNVSYPENIVFNDFKYWNEWFSKVKDYVKSDRPVVTGIDACAWPIYLEIFNLTKPMLAHGGHAIIIVGFNEENKTICVQDPMAGAEKWSNPDRVGYQWISFFDFKRAMRRSHWEFSENSYWFIAVEEVTETPDFDDAFKMAHDRNIERLKGNKSLYDDIFLDDFDKFGIEAFKTLKEDFNSYKFFMMYPFYRILAKITGPVENALPLGWVSGWYIYEAKVLDNMSIFLNEMKLDLTDDNLTEICDYESALFKNASEKFYLLVNETRKLQDILYSKTVFGAFLESKSILNEIVDILDDIIQIQEDIMEGPD